MIECFEFRVCARIQVGAPARSKKDRRARTSGTAVLNACSIHTMPSSGVYFAVNGAFIKGIAYYSERSKCELLASRAVPARWRVHVSRFGAR